LKFTNVVIFILEVCLYKVTTNMNLQRY